MIVTTDANAELEPIHDRMPLLIPRDAHALWLDPRSQPGRRAEARRSGRRRSTFTPSDSASTIRARTTRRLIAPSPSKPRLGLRPRSLLNEQETPPCVREHGARRLDRHELRAFGEPVAFDVFAAVDEDEAVARLRAEGVQLEAQRAGSATPSAASAAGLGSAGASLCGSSARQRTTRAGFRVPAAVRGARRARRRAALAAAAAARSPPATAARAGAACCGRRGAGRRRRQLDAALDGRR